MKKVRLQVIRVYDVLVEDDADPIGAAYRLSTLEVCRQGVLQDATTDHAEVVDEDPEVPGAVLGDPQPTVEVVVEGGVVQDVIRTGFADDHEVRIVVSDYDSGFELDGRVERDESGRAVCRAEW